MTSVDFGYIMLYISNILGGKTRFPKMGELIIGSTIVYETYLDDYIVHIDYPSNEFIIGYHTDLTKDFLGCKVPRSLYDHFKSWWINEINLFAIDVKRFNYDLYRRCCDNLKQIKEPELLIQIIKDNFYNKDIYNLYHAWKMKHDAKNSFSTELITISLC